jgi:hypothetical protein
MPKVGNKHFPYTAKGAADAKEESKETGKKVVKKNNFFQNLKKAALEKKAEKA